MAVDITAEMQQRFRRLAPAALQRRSRAYLNGVAFSSVQMPVLGAIGLAGLYLWGWSPLTLFLMMVAGLLAGILVCTLRWLVARRALRLQVERHNDDRFVWAMAEALRSGKNQIESGELARYRAGAGVVLDWVLGGLALLVLAFAFLKMGMRSTAELFAGGELRWALSAAVALPLAQGVLAIWSWRNPDGAGLEGFGAGIHGVTALILAATFAFGTGPADGLRKLMVGLNAAFIVLGGLSLIGYHVLRQQADWLRKHLE